MTGGFGTPTQEMVESYEYADGSGFLIGVHGILLKVLQLLLLTISWNRALKLPFFIMEQHGKVEL